MVTWWTVLVGSKLRNGELKQLKIKIRSNYDLHLPWVCCDENRKQGSFDRRRVKRRECMCLVITVCVLVEWLCGSRWGHQFSGTLNEKQSNVDIHIFGIITMFALKMDKKISAWFCRVIEHLWFGGRQEQSRWHCRNPVCYKVVFKFQTIMDPYLSD